MLFQNANPKSSDKTNNNNNEIEMIADRADQPMTKWQQFGDNICLKGDGEVNYIDANSKFAMEKVSRRCRFCAKPSAIQPADCINCNLEICEFCGISCMQCNAPLCMSCVQLLWVCNSLNPLFSIEDSLGSHVTFKCCCFCIYSGCCDNSVDMNACCERCKQIYNIQ